MNKIIELVLVTVITVLLSSCTTSTENPYWQGLAQAGWVIISAVAAIFVYIYREIDRQTTKYQNCAKDIQSENETVQVTAAILFRSFLKGKLWARLYRKDSMNLLVALLRTLDASNLQKTLTDSLSFFTKQTAWTFKK